MSNNKYDSKLNNETADLIDDLENEMNILSGDIHQMLHEGSTTIDEVCKDYADMRKAFHVLLITGNLNFETIVQAIDTARNIR